MSDILRKQPTRFAEADLDGEIVLMDQDSGGFVALKATAAAIWALSMASAMPTRSARSCTAVTTAPPMRSTATSICSYISCASAALWRDLARTVEAAAALLIAVALVRFVRFHRWRGLLTLRVRAFPRAAESSEQVAIAIARAERRVLGRSVRCLPRAMAAHWMLRRRGVASVVRIGAMVAGSRPGLDFHAWLDSDGGTVIGESPRRFAPVLMARQG